MDHDYVLYAPMLKMRMLTISLHEFVLWLWNTENVVDLETESRIVQCGCPDHVLERSLIYLNSLSLIN